MMSFHRELQDVMTTLLDTTVVQILQLVQKDFLDKLKQNELEIRGLHMKLQKMVGHLQHSTETGTDEPELIEELAGNAGKTEKNLENIQLDKGGNAESVAETAGAEIIGGTGSELLQSDMRSGDQFIDSWGGAGNESQRQKEGQKARRKSKRVRVKSEKEDGYDLVNEKSVDEVVVPKLEDPPQIEGHECHEDSESPEGAEHQVYLLEEHDNLSNVSLDESTAQHCPVDTESKFSRGREKNRCISPLATYNCQIGVSKEYLAKAKVALMKMEGLPDRGWVLLDPLTGKFCIKDELDFKPEGIERDEQDDDDAAEGPSSDSRSRNGTRSAGTGVQADTNSSSQTDAEITVTMTEDESDEINLNSSPVEREEPNRVVTRSSKASRANGSNARSNETSDALSPRGYATRSAGNALSDRTEGVERRTNGASCLTGSISGKKVNSDSGKGNVRLSKEVFISSKVQKAKSKKDPNIKFQASEASTNKKTLIASDKANSKNIRKAKKQSYKFENRVYRSGHFIITQDSLTKSKKEVALKTSGQIYTAKVKLRGTNEQGFKVKNEFHPKGKVFECKHCAKTFPTLQYLKKHWEYHSATKKHVCSRCGKGFVYECHLRIHMQSHTNERPFQCTQCGKRFTYRSSLTYHLLYHTGQRPHVCLQCGMTFSRRGHLVKHITCHSGLRPYSCSNCGKTFTAKGGLTRHERIHQKKSKSR